MKKKIEIIMAVCLVIAAFFLGSQSAILVQNSHIDTKGTPDTDSAHNTELTGDTGQTSSPSGNLSIVIDAGHGGIDPGKVGTNDALEKDINLALALKLRDKFKQDSIRIILTRDSDIGLYSEGNTGGSPHLYGQPAPEQLSVSGSLRCTGILFWSVAGWKKTGRYDPGQPDRKC